MPTEAHRQTRLEESHADILGTVVATRQVPGFQVTEKYFPAGLELTSHRHQQAHFCYVLAGPFTESYGNTGSVTCPPRALRYLPPEQNHSNVFQSATHCLIVAVETETLKRVTEHSRKLDQPGEIQGLASGWLAQRLYREFREDDGLAVVSLEGILLEILAESARHSSTASAVMIPRWLRTARDYMEANFLSQLSLAEIAASAGVHRVHLSREFHRYFSTTIGEFLRHKRIQHACHMVSTTETPLADIATACGFSDQSHFSATFRRQFGLTPAKYRRSTHAIEPPPEPPPDPVYPAWHSE